MDINTQRRVSIETEVFNQFSQWIAQRIRQLSVDALASEIFTCTACGEIEGDYIVVYQGETFRFDAVTTYGFLQFILENASTAES